jgi:uncharacterized delta-60 repeat protein
MVMGLPAQAAPGDLDISFGDDGRVTTRSCSRCDNEAFAMAIQPDGKIVAAGDSFLHFSDKFEVTRYRPSGRLDPTFGGDGIVTTRFGRRSDDTASAVAIQSDGKIVAVGSRRNRSRARFALARYAPDGTLDSTFGGDGKVTSQFARESDDVAAAAAIQADGRIVAVGSSFLSHGQFALARYAPDGSLDSTFGGDGEVTTSFGPDDDAQPLALAIQPDGKIVAVGFIRHSIFDTEFALARYNVDGSLDPTFDGDGKVTTHAEGNDSDLAQGVAIQSDGKVLVVGLTGTPEVERFRFALARYNTDGSLDPTFGGDGKVTTSFTARSSDLANAVAVQADGKIVAAGTTFRDIDGLQKFALARYNPDGTLDSTFGVAGKVTTSFGKRTYDVASAVAIADGKIVATGASYGFVHAKFALARYLAA